MDLSSGYGNGDKWWDSEYILKTDKDLLIDIVVVWMMAIQG